MERVKANILYSKTIDLMIDWSCRLWDNVEKYGRNRQVGEDNIIRLTRIVYWINKAPNTRIFVLITHFTSEVEPWLCRSKFYFFNIRITMLFPKVNLNLIFVYHLKITSKRQNTVGITTWHFVKRRHVLSFKWTLQSMHMKLALVICLWTSLRALLIQINVAYRRCRLTLSQTYM